MRRRTTPRTPPAFDVSWRQRIRYRFDNVLARGTTAALVWLGVVTFATVLVSAMLLTIFGVTFTGSEQSGLIEDFWQSLLRILDTGTMAGDVGWGRRILALLITLFGLLIAGTLIGIIAAGVEDRIDSMRRGRSTVIESGHLVILGGVNRIPGIIEQLVIANVGREESTIVVLAQTDPTELRRAVNAATRTTKGLASSTASAIPGCVPISHLLASGGLVASSCCPSKTATTCRSHRRC